MPKLKKIILATGAPTNSGLAHFHYLAMRDISKYEVRIIDNGQQTYGRSTWGRVQSAASRLSGGIAKRQYGRILEEVNGRPGEVALILYHLGCLTPRQIGGLHRIGVKLYGYFSDSPFGMNPATWEKARQVLPLFRSVFTFVRDLPPVFYQYGARRVKRIPFGYCKYTHLAPSDAVLRPFDGNLYYFGTYGKLIEEWLIPLLKYNLVIIGHDWGTSKHPGIRAAVRQGVLHDSEMARMAGGQLVVNFVRAQHGAAHSMKTFELPAAGACVLTNRSDEQLEFWPEGGTVSYFNTQEELDGLISSFISAPALIRSRLNGTSRFLAGASYHDRVPGILHEIEDSFQ